MHLGFWPGAMLEKADAVLALDTDVPWIPSQESPVTGAKVAHLGIDPTYSRYPMRSFRSDLSIAADSRAALPQLSEALAIAARPHAALIERRRQRFKELHDELIAQGQRMLEEVRTQSPIHPAWVTDCIERVRGQDSILVNEYPMVREQLSTSGPGSLFINSPAGGARLGSRRCLGRQEPTIIEAAGNRPKRIEEFAGRVNTDHTAVSVARMKSPQGWVAPGQRPEFEEITVVLSGLLRVEHEGGTLDVSAGQGVVTSPGKWVRYSTPLPVGADYIAVCLPAFSPQTVHRDEP